MDIYLKKEFDDLHSIGEEETLFALADVSKVNKIKINKKYKPVLVGGGNYLVKEIVYDQFEDALILSVDGFENTCNKEVYRAMGWKDKNQLGW